MGREIRSIEFVMTSQSLVDGEGHVMKDKRFIRIDHRVGKDQRNFYFRYSVCVKVKKHWKFEVFIFVVSQKVSLSTCI